ncbi:MAG: transposase [Reyranella sp.]
MRSRCAEAIPIASSSVTCSLGGRSGLAALIARRRAWRGSTPTWGPEKCGQIRLAVMDMWKPFRNAATAAAPQAAILRDEEYLRLEVLTCMLDPL